jgi:hypothetical protein
MPVPFCGLWASAESENETSDWLTQTLKDSNDTVNRIFGAKGFWDGPLSLRLSPAK